MLALACAAFVGAQEFEPAIFLHYEELQRGRFRKAAEFAAQDQAPVEIVARHALETQDWNGAMALVDQPSDADGIAAYARGIAAARAAWERGQPDLLDIARASAMLLEQRTLRQGSSSLAELQRVCVRAAIAAAQEERAELEVLLVHAASMTLRPAPPRAPTHPIIPVHELAGDLWLQVSRLRDAVREYAAAVEQHPRRPRPLMGLARAYARSGNTARARTAYESLLVLWKDADAGRPELVEATRFLERYP